MANPENRKAKRPTVPPSLIIPRTAYPKWWKDARTWKIDIKEAGLYRVIDKTPGYRVYVTNIVLTVSGETNIILGMGVFGDSGAMDFGGENEPRGIVIAMGNSPLPCGEGGLTIDSDGPTVHVGGFITYYYEKE